jgi:hypothetical protein
MINSRGAVFAENALFFCSDFLRLKNQNKSSTWAGLSAELLCYAFQNGSVVFCFSVSQPKAKRKINLSVLCAFAVKIL